MVVFYRDPQELPCECTQVARLGIPVGPHLSQMADKIAGRKELELSFDCAVQGGWPFDLAHCTQALIGCCPHH